MTPDSSPPLVAILRGLEPARARAVGEALYAEGFRAIEVPLNSPEPYTSIEHLAAGLPPDCEVGAGTVLAAGDVVRARDAGGRLVVAPNCDAAVIAQAVHLGLRVLPGIATATEAFQALAAGATQLKLFPAVTYGPRHLQALRSVLPKSVAVYPVGGVGLAELAAWLAAGAAGFGFGSELFQPGLEVEEITRRARRVQQAWRAARSEP